MRRIGYWLLVITIYYQLYRLAELLSYEFYDLVKLPWQIKDICNFTIFTPIVFILLPCVAMIIGDKILQQWKEK